MPARQDVRTRATATHVEIKGYFKPTSTAQVEVVPHMKGLLMANLFFMRKSFEVQGRC